MRHMEFSHPKHVQPSFQVDYMVIDVTAEPNLCFKAYLPKLVPILTEGSSRFSAAYDDMPVILTRDRTEWDSRWPDCMT